MSDLLKSLTSGIARFVMAWMLPTALAVGLFWGVCVPALSKSDLVPAVTGKSGRNVGAALGLAAFTVFAVSTLLAYASQIIYRLLEGYHLPRSVDRWLTARQMRRRERLLAVRRVADGGPPAARQTKRYGIALEQLGLFPPSPDLVMPTRLGNALRQMEGYGTDRFGLDSQQFWYELIGTAQPAVRREQEEARAQVDLFVAAVAASICLALTSTLVGLSTGRAGPWWLALSALGFTTVAYRGAVRNMKEWSNSVRALVNLGRLDVADRMGLVVPHRLDEEIRLWQSVSAVLHYRDDRWRPWLDVFRRRPNTPAKAIRFRSAVEPTLPRTRATRR